MILIRRQRLITRRDIARPPEIAAGPLSNGLVVAHDLTGPHWATNLVTGVVAGASVGTGPVIGSLGYLATPNSNGNGFTLPHRLSSGAGSWTIAVGMAKTAGSTCLSCMTSDVDAWTGWYCNGDSSINSSFENSFDGSASAAGTRDQNGMSSIVFTYGGANTLSAYGNSKNSQTDTSHVAPFGAYSFPSIVSFGFAKHGSFSDNPSACRFSHFYVWNRILPVFDAWAIAENPRRIFAPRKTRRIFPSASPGSSYTDTLTESLALAESLGSVLQALSAAGESIALAAAESSSLSALGAVAEDVTVVSAESAALVGAAALSESVALADSVSPDAATYTEALAEAISLADSLAAALVAAGAVTESIAPAAAFADTVSKEEQLSFAVGLADSLATQLDAIGAIADALSLADAPVSQWDGSELIAQALTLGAALADSLDGESVAVLAAPRSTRQSPGARRPASLSTSRR